MSSFAKYIDGSPTNTATGVVTQGVKIDPERLTALVILGIRDKETFPLIFYRDNCADMALTMDDIDPDFIRSAKSVVLSGTHFSTANYKRLHGSVHPQSVKR